MECIFCKIAKRELETNVIYEDDEIIAFDDLNPQAPHHKLIIPKRHIPTLNNLEVDDAALVGRIILTAKKIAHDLKIADEGYRMVFNCNRNAGQEVFHIHLHLLGGRPMQWPPG